MRSLRDYFFEYNKNDNIKYIFSLIGLFCYFLMFILLNDGTSIQATFWLGLFVIIASYSVGRYCINRYLYVTDKDILTERITISSVLRFHAFDADNYFAGIKKKLFKPVLCTLLFTIFFSAIELILGEKGISHAVSILILGVLAILMVYIAYYLKKMIFVRELNVGTDTSFSTALRIIVVVFQLFEFIGMFVGLAVATLLIWLFFGAAIETGINDSEIVYRSYTSFNSYIFLILTLVAFIFGMTQIYSKRMGKILFILSGALFIITIVLTYVQTKRYTELSENKFCIYNFGLVKEYNIQEVESFKIYQDNFTNDLQLELAFNDGNTYKVIKSVTTCSEKYEQMYYSDYNFVADYAGKLLGQGVSGTLEDRKELEENAYELHENVQKGWQDIVNKMDG